MTDIRFEGQEVVVEGANTKLLTNDFMIDAPSRRTTAGGHRRALVHDFSDGLTMNFLNDYPGGVSISGLKTVGGSNGNDRIDIVSRVVAVAGSDLMLDAPDRRTNQSSFRRALVHDFNDGLTLNFNHDYPGGVTLSGPVTIPDGATVAGVDVAAALASLTAQVAALTERIAALEPANPEG